MFDVLTIITLYQIIYDFIGGIDGTRIGVRVSKNGNVAYIGCCSSPT